MTIPDLLEQDWLAMKERGHFSFPSYSPFVLAKGPFSFLAAEPPAVKDLLAPDETVINPYYMRQLLQYGIKLGEAQSADMSPEAMLREAEVSSLFLTFLYPLADCRLSTPAPCSRAQIYSTIAFWSG
jgi:serine/threonine-protein kinase TTK/MPS1